MLKKRIREEFIGIDLGQIFCRALHIMGYGKAGDYIFNGYLTIDVEGRVHGFYRAVFHDDRIGGLIFKMGVNQMDRLKPGTVCLDGILEMQIIHRAGAKTFGAGANYICLNVQQLLTKAGDRTDILLPIVGYFRDS